MKYKKVKPPYIPNYKKPANDVAGFFNRMNYLSELF